MRVCLLLLALVVCLSAESADRQAVATNAQQARRVQAAKAARRARARPSPQANVEIRTTPNANSNVHPNANTNPNINAQIDTNSNTLPRVNLNVQHNGLSESESHCCAVVLGNTCFCSSTSITNGCQCHRMRSLSFVYLGDDEISYIKVFDTNTKQHQCRFRSVNTGDELTCTPQGSLLSLFTTILVRKTDGSLCRGIFETGCQGENIIGIESNGCNEIMATGFAAGDGEQCNDGLEPCECAPLENQPQELPPPITRVSPIAEPLTQTQTQARPQTQAKVQPQTQKGVTGGGGGGYYGGYGYYGSPSFSDSFSLSLSLSDSYEPYPYYPYKPTGKPRPTSSTIIVGSLNDDVGELLGVDNGVDTISNNLDLQEESAGDLGNNDIASDAVNEPVDVDVDANSQYKHDLIFESPITAPANAQAEVNGVNGGGGGYGYGYYGSLSDSLSLSDSYDGGYGYGYGYGYGSGYYKGGYYGSISDSLSLSLSLSDSYDDYYYAGGKLSAAEQVAQYNAVENRATNPTNPKTPNTHTNAANSQQNNVHVQNAAGTNALSGGGGGYGYGYYPIYSDSIGSFDSVGSFDSIDSFSDSLINDVYIADEVADVDVADAEASDIDPIHVELPANNVDIAANNPNNNQNENVIMQSDTMTNGVDAFPGVNQADEDHKKASEQLGSSNAQFMVEHDPQTMPYLTYLVLLILLLNATLLAYCIYVTKKYRKEQSLTLHTGFLTGQQPPLDSLTDNDEVDRFEEDNEANIPESSLSDLEADTPQEEVDPLDEDSEPVPVPGPQPSV